jgi:hypothetical protein
MGIHDWTRVTAGTFHDFHTAWIAELRQVLNGGVLPADYYAMAEQVAGLTIPDVLTLQDAEGSGGARGAWKKGDDDEGAGGVALATAPPHVAVGDTLTPARVLAARKRRLVIRHTTGDRIVAILEIVSPGNKEKRAALDQFVDKAVGAINEGLHLMVLDLFPPGPFDPRGIHGAIWGRMGGAYDPPAAKPLTLAGYASGEVVTCYVEPTAVGTELIPMPLFLTPGRYVNVPLEATYLGAYEGVPRRWKRVIEGEA